MPMISDLCWKHVIICGVPGAVPELKHRFSQSQINKAINSIRLSML